MGTTPAGDVPPAAAGFLARVRSDWARVWWGGAPDGRPSRQQDADRARAQAEVDRLNAHRQTGRFGGGTF